jgi:hypothetical protein
MSAVAGIQNGWIYAALTAQQLNIYPGENVKHEMF